jgi:acyl carrier protein
VKVMRHIDSQDGAAATDLDLPGTGEPPAGADHIQERVVGVLSGVLGCELVGVTAQTRLFEELGLDSTGVLETMLAVEEDLGVQFDPEALMPSNFATVGALADLVRASR